MHTTHSPHFKIRLDELKMKWTWNGFISCRASEMHYSLRHHIVLLYLHRMQNCGVHVVWFIFFSFDEQFERRTKKKIILPFLTEKQCSCTQFLGHKQASTHECKTSFHLIYVNFKTRFEYQVIRNSVQLKMRQTHNSSKVNELRIEPCNVPAIRREPSSKLVFGQFYANICAFYWLFVSLHVIRHWKIQNRAHLHANEKELITIICTT